jgi:phage baseplate assembly protein W
MALANSQVVFSGYCSVGPATTRNWVFYDIDLVKRDLMFAFNTRVGERVMRPDWGCKIWDYLMEPLTNGMQDLIVSEATRICQLDSRVAIVSVNAYTAGAGVRVELTLSFNPYGVVDTFYVDFDTRQDAELGFQ